jgi:hypothetical protein
VKRFYVITRNPHLYLGLFLSPLILLFAVSVFFLVHATIPGASRLPTIRTATGIHIPASVEFLNGREQVDALRPVLDSLGVHGEANFIRRFSKGHRLVIPLTILGHETSIDLNLETRSAVISERTTGVWSAMAYLHKMPG